MKSWKLMDGDVCLLNMDGADAQTLPVLPTGQRWIEVPAPATEHIATPDGSGDYTVTPQPYDIASARAAKVVAIRTRRELAWETCTTDKGVFDFGKVTGTTSGRDNIQDTLTAAGIMADQGAAPPETITWRLHDNSEVPVTLADLQAAMMAGTLAKQTAYATSWALEAQIAAATTQEQLDTITWPANG